MSFAPIEQQLELIRRGTQEILPEEALIEKLKRSRRTNKSLQVKLGCDPSRPDLHLGHAVVLRKMRHFQDLGHQATLVIGDFTAMIGDPSGRKKTRPQLTLEETRENARSYVEQAKVILDINSLKIVNNSDWLGKYNFSDVITLASHYTVARILERDDFARRYRSQVPISIHEFLYPLAQGMDSVKLEADVELGGTDQKFNLLVGRDLQREYGQDPQVIITLPLLEGTDGVEKMSKSHDNHIGLLETPQEMYGKTMSIPDEMIEKYFLLAADADEEQLSRIRSRRADPGVNPRDLKRELARSIVSLYHGGEKAREAEQHFDRVIVQKGVPAEIPVYRLQAAQALVDVLATARLVPSKSEARRLIRQGAVRLGGDPCRDIDHQLTPPQEVVIKVGKRRFIKVVG